MTDTNAIVNAKEKYKKYKYKYIQLKHQVAGNAYMRVPKQKYFTTDQGYTIYFHEIDFESLTPEDITQNPAKPSVNKVLVINDVGAFDVFTKLYADANFERRYMFVKWEKVAANFRGFYLNQDDKTFKLMAYYTYNYKDKHIFKSWWHNEYDNFSSKVIIFDK